MVEVTSHDRPSKFVSLAELASEPPKGDSLCVGLDLFGNNDQAQGSA